MNATKQYCAVCDCVVVPFEHEKRCRPKQVRGWSEQRLAAWTGDSVHRLDVQMAVQLLGVAPELWESTVQQYISNAAQAAYVREHVVGLEQRSEHAVGTEFESRYFGSFRVEYLRVKFPTVSSWILAAWQPPVLDVYRQSAFVLAEQV